MCLRRTLSPSCASARRRRRASRRGEAEGYTSTMEQLRAVKIEPDDAGGLRRLCKEGARIAPDVPQPQDDADDDVGDGGVVARRRTRRALVQAPGAGRRAPEALGWGLAARRRRAVDRRLGRRGASQGALVALRALPMSKDTMEEVIEARPSGAPPTPPRRRARRLRRQEGVERWAEDGAARLRRVWKTTRGEREREEAGRVRFFSGVTINTEGEGGVGSGVVRALDQSAIRRTAPPQTTSGGGTAPLAAAELPDDEALARRRRRDGGGDGGVRLRRVLGALGGGSVAGDALGQRAEPVEVGLLDGGGTRAPRRAAGSARSVHSGAGPAIFSSAPSALISSTAPRPPLLERRRAPHVVLRRHRRRVDAATREKSAGTSTSAAAAAAARRLRPSRCEMYGALGLEVEHDVAEVEADERGAAMVAEQRRVRLRRARERRRRTPSSRRRRRRPAAPRPSAASGSSRRARRARGAAGTTASTRCR